MTDQRRRWADVRPRITLPAPYAADWIEVAFDVPEEAQRDVNTLRYKAAELCRTAAPGSQAEVSARLVELQVLCDYRVTAHSFAPALPIGPGFYGALLYQPEGAVRPVRFAVEPNVLPSFRAVVLPGEQPEGDARLVRLEVEPGVRTFTLPVDRRAEAILRAVLATIPDGLEIVGEHGYGNGLMDRVIAHLTH